MKRMILGMSLIVSGLCAEVKTLVPYLGVIDYGGDSAKSVKDKATLVGTSFSIGNLDYLVEFDYSHINSKYKESNVSISDLSQNDISLMYSKYYTNFMFKIGDHYINTTDSQLGNGNTLIASVGGYKWFGYNKLSYGLEGYYTYFSKGHDENYLTEKSIGILQFTPYMSYYKSLNLNWGNTVAFKLNHQITNDYLQKSYTSFEISDTVHYKSGFMTFKAYGGEMKTGVKDGGATVFNTLDTLKNGYGVKVGYFVRPELVLSASYDKNNYREYDVGATIGSATITGDAQNSVFVVSLSYSF